MAVAVLMLLATPTPGAAQFGKRLKDAVKRTAEDEAIGKATEAERKAIGEAAATADPPTSVSVAFSCTAIIADTAPSPV